MVDYDFDHFQEFCLRFFFFQMWIFTKLIECYIRWTYPLKKYGTVPEHSLNKQFKSSMTSTLPSHFYDAVEEGSLILRKSRSFSFCKSGLIVDGDTSKVVETDIVIFATGFLSYEKLKNMFASTYFQKCITGSSAPLYRYWSWKFPVTGVSSSPLNKESLSFIWFIKSYYRECIHPRIPQLAILGYMDGTSVLHLTEMRSKWLAHFLTGCFKLPSIKEMEADVMEWERCARRYAKESYKPHRVSVLLQIYCNDLLCKDMGYNPWRKRSLLAELFAPYGPADYRDLTPPHPRKPIRITLTWYICTLSMFYPLAYYRTDWTEDASSFKECMTWRDYGCFTRDATKQ